MLILECPWNKCREPPGLILQHAKFFQAIDTMPRRFANSDHHGCRRFQIQLVRFAMHHEPVATIAFHGTDIGSYLVTESLAAAPGQGIESGSLKASKRFRYCQLRD